jgi:hypothetical protein
MKIIFLLFSALFAHSIQAQRFDWSTSAGYPGINNSYYGTVDLTTDSDGNVYVVIGDAKDPLIVFLLEDFS